MIIDPPSDPAVAASSMSSGKHTAPSLVRPLFIAIYMPDLSGGGVERQCLALVPELQAQGMRVTLVLHQNSGELLNKIPKGLRVVDLQSRRTLLDVPALIRYLRRERPDVLMANLDHNNVAAMLAKGLSMTKTKLVICQHNPLTSPYFHTMDWSYRLIPFLYRILSPFAKRAVGVSVGISNELCTVAGISPRKVVTIYNPVIGQDFEDRARQIVSHPWLDRKDVPIFITAGRLVAMKDHETLLRALERHCRNKPARLLILGVGPMRERLDALVKELNLIGAVDFLGFKDNPLPYLRMADVFVLSSISEGFGNVLVEAMGCGTPVISTNCQYGPSEILEDGKYGVLVPQSDVRAMADAMSSLLDFRDRWPSSVLKARANEFTTAACADKYGKLFHSL